jgi:hypothetical protein
LIAVAAVAAIVAAENDLFGPSGHPPIPHLRWTVVPYYSAFTVDHHPAFFRQTKHAADDDMSSFVDG